MESKEEFVSKSGRNKSLQAGRRVSGRSHQRTIHCAPLVWETLVCFRFSYSLISWSLYIEKNGNGRTYNRDTHGECVCVCVWPARPGLPKIEDDLVSCLSPTLPSLSLAVNHFSLVYQPRLQLPLSAHDCVPLTCLNARLLVLF